MPNDYYPANDIPVRRSTESLATWFKSPDPDDPSSVLQRFQKEVLWLLDSELHVRLMVNERKVQAITTLCDAGGFLSVLNYGTEWAEWADYYGAQPKASFVVRVEAELTVSEIPTRYTGYDHIRSKFIQLSEDWYVGDESVFQQIEEQRKNPNGSTFLSGDYRLKPRELFREIVWRSDRRRDSFDLTALQRNLRKDFETGLSAGDISGSTE